MQEFYPFRSNLRNMIESVLFTIFISKFYLFQVLFCFILKGRLVDFMFLSNSFVGQHKLIRYEMRYYMNINWS